MSTPTFGFKLEDVDDVVHAVPGRTRIAASKSLDQHRRFPLVVQLLRFALWPRSYNEHKDLLTCEPQPW